MEHHSNVLDDVRRALGQTGPRTHVPQPPVIDDAIARMVSPAADLPKIFTERATANKIKVEMLTPAELKSHLVEHLHEKHCRRIALPVSPLLERLNVKRDLTAAGFEAKTWDEISLDQLYDFDAGVTDVYATVAEIGGLVVRSSPQHGRALSLVPMVHVAIVERKDFVPDLIDLFGNMTQGERPAGTVIITGPSKTADIEMNLVTGVHGPGFVKVFILDEPA